MVKISGFTIVRNAIKLDFPVEASIRSILPICDEVVVNVGRSDDDTLALIRSIGDPKIRIIETEWDMSGGNSVLGTHGGSTSRRMKCCTMTGRRIWQPPFNGMMATSGWRGCWSVTCISMAGSTPWPRTGGGIAERYARSDSVPGWM